MDRNNIALAVLAPMVIQGGEKHDKVRAAFDFAEIFMQESAIRAQARELDELHMIVEISRLRKVLTSYLTTELGYSVGIDEIDRIVQDLKGEL